MPPRFPLSKFSRQTALLQDVALRRLEEVLLPGVGADAQHAVQGVDRQPVGVDGPDGRLGPGVAVDAVGHALGDAALQPVPLGDAPGDDLPGREVPHDPVGKALDGVGHVL